MDRVKKRTIIFPKKGAFQLVSEEISLANGKTAEHMTLEHTGAVVILPVTAEGGLIMIRQYRHSVRKELLEFPAGTLKEDEDPRVCADRELSEETGFGSKNFTDLGIVYPAPGFCSEKQYLYLATDLFERRFECDEDEEITNEIVSISQFYDHLKSGVVCDAKSIAIFAKAKLLELI